MTLQVYTQEATGSDGRTYGLRYLLTPLELSHLQSVGLIGRPVSRIVGMQQAADQTVADFERQAHVFAGGSLQ